MYQVHQRSSENTATTRHEDRINEMKKKVKERFQEMIMESLKEMPTYPSNHQSDTTWISVNLARKHEKELVEMGIVPEELLSIPFIPTIPNQPRDSVIGWRIQNRVLRQLNNLHKSGKVEKTIDYGGEGKGRNYTFIRWGKHA
jgi:hypothetical protein